MGQENVASVLGPMCTNLGGCVAFTRGILSTEPWTIDPEVVPIPWNEDQYRLSREGGHDNAKLVFGFYDFDGLVHVHPPAKRALKLTVEALERAGHSGEWISVL
jgi:amidase